MIERVTQSRYFYFFILFLYSMGLWHMSVPLTGDQKLYLSIALEMRKRGEWIIPYFFDRPYFNKPPFQYWFTLLGWKVFGLSLFGALIPSVLALLVAAWLVNQISKIVNQSDSRLPGFFFAASLGSMTYGTIAQMEVWIVLFYLWAWREFLLHRWTRTFLIVGVMAWIKGPLYPALWVMSAIFWLKLESRFREVWSRRFLKRLFLGVFVGLSWYALAARTQYQEMMRGFFLQENLSKMKTTQGTPWGLWGEFFYALWPWLLWLFFSFSLREVRQRVAAQKKFYLAFALIPAIFFTFFPYRVSTYLYLLTPAAAWMLSTHIEKRNSYWLGGATLLTSAALFFVSWRLAAGSWLDQGLLVGLACALLLWTFGFFKLNPGITMTASLLLVNLIRLAAVEIGEKDLEGLRKYQEARTDSKSIGYWIDQEDVWHEFGILSAALGEEIQRIRSKDELKNFLSSGGSIIFQEEPHDLNFALQCQKWERFKKRIKFPLKTLLQDGLSWDDSSVKRTCFICHL